MATLGRSRDVVEYIASLSRQKYNRFELIVVDQNYDNRIEDILDRSTASFKIIHLRSLPGLSVARNIGLTNATGDVVAFPDDDCRYPPDLLHHVADWFKSHQEYVGLSGRSVDDQNCSTVSLFDNNPGEITKENIWRRMTSVGLFFRWNSSTNHLRFDPDLGLGSRLGFGAAEDIDLPLRILESGGRLYYDPRIGVYHPPVVTTYDIAAAKRAFVYGGGIGRVLVMHKYPLHSKARALLRPLGGTAFSLLTARPGKARFHWMAFKGRLRGMIL